MKTEFSVTPLEAALFYADIFGFESLRKHAQAQAKVTSALKRKGLLKIIKSGSYPFRIDPIACWNETNSSEGITTEIFFGLIDSRNITKGAERFPGLFASPMNGYRPNLYLDIEALDKTDSERDFSLSLILPIVAQVGERILGRVFQAHNSGIGLSSNRGALASADDLQLVPYSESVGFLDLFTHYIERWNEEWGKPNRSSCKPILF
ncbi:hypothetical protein GYA49_06475 [Candidatus Beckwithbacteria bacterium]|nr:hypothetical protein [Candidatus Beckwithbacteria bacterium]